MSFSYHFPAAVPYPEQEITFFQVDGKPRATLRDTVSGDQGMIYKALSPYDKGMLRIPEGEEEGFTKDHIAKLILGHFYGVETADTYSSAFRERFLDPHTDGIIKSADIYAWLNDYRAKHQTIADFSRGEWKAEFESSPSFYCLVNIGDTKSVAAIHHGPNARANALLIEAAPRMFAALQRCTDVIRNVPKQKEAQYESPLREAYLAAMEILNPSGKGQDESLNMAGPLSGYAENPTRLCDQFGDRGVWNEHPDFPRSDWQYEVANEDTIAGYWDYVQSRIDQAAGEALETDKGRMWWIADNQEELDAWKKDWEGQPVEIIKEEPHNDGSTRIDVIFELEKSKAPTILGYHVIDDGEWLETDDESSPSPR